jgi:hypothetical protein
MLRLLTQSEAARVLGLSERTLERLRLQGGGPLYVKAGRAVRYRETYASQMATSKFVSAICPTSPPPNYGSGTYLAET